MRSAGGAAVGLSVGRCPVIQQRQQQRCGRTGRLTTVTPKLWAAAAFGWCFTSLWDAALANIWSSRLIVKLLFLVPAWCVAGITYEVTGVSISPVEPSVPYWAAGTGLSLKVSEGTQRAVPSLLAPHAGCQSEHTSLSAFRFLTALQHTGVSGWGLPRLTGETHGWQLMRGVYLRGDLYTSGLTSKHF